MPREHWNDVPGDIAGSDAENLPGGFGTYNPDNDPDATIDEITENDVIAPTGRQFTPLDAQGGSTAGTSYAEGNNTGATVDPNELVEGEEAHPGAGIGFTGDEYDKVAPPWAPVAHPESAGPSPAQGGAPSEPETEQQLRDFSIESEGPVGGQGAAGNIKPKGGKKAA